MNPAELATLLAVFAVAVVAPGADFAFVVRESVAYGRRAGLMAALGVSAAILVHTTYTVLGIGLVVSQSILLFNIIKWAGVAYLVFIGIMSLKAAVPSLVIDEGRSRAPRPLGRSFGLGFLTNLLNPKATLFFVSLFTAIVSHETPLYAQFTYGGLMALMMVVWFTLVAVVFAAPAIRSGFVRMGRWFDRATGLVFIALGLRLALQRAN